MDFWEFMLARKQGGGGSSGGGGSGGGGGAAEEWIGDGNTHLWISLPEGRTSPMLGLAVNGTVTVDWGDGSSPDVLTGTSVYGYIWTPNHEYGKAGDYVITLTADGEMGINGDGLSSKSAILRFSSDSADNLNQVYACALKKVELGNSVTRIGGYAFSHCFSLAEINISESVTSVENYAFAYCYSLKSAVIPNSVTTLGSNAFFYCYSLTNVKISNNITTIGSNTFKYCYSLAKVEMPDNIISIGKDAFSNCHILSVNMPDSVTTIGDYAFYNCYLLPSINIPSKATSVGSYAFGSCYSFTYVNVPKSLTTISANLFNGCYGMKVVDFSSHAAVPALKAVSAFNNIAADCEIRVPAALVDEWKAATNWSSLASKIVGV